MDSTPETKPTKPPPPPPPLSKFEDSPVFNFINSLSPIKPVKSNHTVQTFNSISFPSLPVFTSLPQFSPLKSPKRPNFSNASRSPSAVSKNKGAVILMDQLLEIFVPGIPPGDDLTPRVQPPEMVNSGAGEAHGVINGDVLNRTENQPLSNLQGGNMPRRCLDFEMAGMLLPAAAAAPGDGSFRGSSSSSSSSSSSFRCTLPRIGLHLNALASSLKRSDSENLCSERRPGFSSSSAAIFTSNSIQDKFLFASSTPESENPQEPASLIGEDFNQINPIKNGKSMDVTGNGACKRCNCKKSRCLKLYCECFAAGVYCIEACSCLDCFNKPIHESVVLETRRQIESRNPLAFAPKVILNSDSVSELGEDSNKTPASARHKRGCNCKKSNCLKKYCECYQGGVGCSINCRCEGCKNGFGRKDESALIGTETQQEEEGREHYQKNAEVQSDEGQQNSINSAPSTQLGPRRSLISLPFHLKRRLPSSYLDDESSSRLSVRFKLDEQGIIQTEAPPKFERTTTPCEDVMPETVSNECPSSTGGVKNVSPNSKRVGLPPPQGDFRPLPSTRISRKLILQSIPSFPSFTNPNSNEWTQ
ncbi:CRC domain-containing protein TSO1, partial [Cucurbita argyrosperma subsp. sororia]